MGLLARVGWRSRGTLALFAVLVLVWCAPGASAASWQALVSDSSSASSVWPIDLGTNVAGSAVATSGSGGLGVAISPDARTAYVVNANQSGLTGQITPVDLTRSPPVAEASIDIPNSPGTFIAISPDGRKAYMSDPRDGEVFPIDLSTSPATVAAAIVVGGNPEGIAFSPDGSRAYVAMNAANGGTAEVLPIIVATDAVGTAITGLGPHPYWIAVTPDGTKAYVSDAGAGTNGKVYPVALPAGTVGSPISIGSSVTGIAVTPDGSKAYAIGASAVVPITVSSDTAGTAIPVTGGAYALAVTPDSKTVYVTNDTGRTVTPIDVATGVPGAAISSVGGGPRGIAITPDQAPVANFAVASGPPGSATSFDASASTVLFGAIVKYVWDFGDGTPPVTTSTPTTSHAYASASTYTATVTETDSAGTSVSGEVFTGQSASGVGNASALTTRSVVISTAPQPAVTLSAPSFAFGIGAVGQSSAPQTLTITNNGAAPLAIAGSAISGANGSSFALSADSCTAQTIPAGGTCTTMITFTPGAPGQANAQLAFADNASGSPQTVPLTGIGTTVGSVTGHVYDASTTPETALAGAFVSICPRGGAATSCDTVRTDSSGLYNVPNLTPGPYAMEVNAVSAGLTRGSALPTIAAGPPTVQDFGLQTSSPLPNSITITTQNGSTTGGNPVLYWDAPFQITLPPLIAAPAHATPNSLIITTVDVALSSGSQPVIASSLIYLTLYDASGNATSGIAGAQTLPGATAGGFAFTFGGLAIPTGNAIAQSSSLGTATQLVAQTTGLNRQALGTLTLTIDGQRVASTPAAPTGSQRRPGTSTAHATVTAACTAATQAYVNFEAAADNTADQGPVADFGPDAGLAVVQELEFLQATQENACGVQDPNPSPRCTDNIFTQNCEPDPDCQAQQQCDVPVDPSGFVMTRTGIPLEHARVVLQRSDAAGGPFAPLPNGSPEMSSANRRNPDFTDLNGHFGWDVFPGFYRVAASRHGCRGTVLSRSSPVPPPVTNLSLKLNCPGLHRLPTLTRILSVKLHGPDTIVAVSVARTSRRGSRPTGLITLQIPKQRGRFAFLNTRTGRATIVLAGHLRPRTRIAVRYAGNARFAPSSERSRR